MSIEDRIVKCVCDVTQYTGNVHPHDPLQELGIDSLNMIELIVALERNFHFTLDDEDMLIDHFRSVATIQELINRYIHEGKISFSLLEESGS